jgi:cell division protein FtsL
MKRDKKKRVFLCKFERFMYKLCIAAIIGLIVGIVCSEARLAQVNVEVQKMEKEVDTQKNKQESLEMKIDEMTSLDNIKEISAEYGLEYHSENIKTID